MKTYPKRCLAFALGGVWGFPEGKQGAGGACREHCGYLTWGGVGLGVNRAPDGGARRGQAGMDRRSGAPERVVN